MENGNWTSKTRTYQDQRDESIERVYLEYPESEWKAETEKIREHYKDKYGI